MCFLLIRNFLSFYLQLFVFQKSRKVYKMIQGLQVTKPQVFYIWQS